IYQITPEVIFNNDNQDNSLNLGLAIEFTKRNFMGGARKLSSTFSVASTDPLKFVKDLSLSDSLYGYADARIAIEQPTFFGEPINTVYEGYYTIRKRSDEYNTSLYGGKINLNFDLPRFTYVTSLSTFLNFERENTNYKRNYLHKRFFNFFKTAQNDSTDVNKVVNYLLDTGGFDNSESSNMLFGFNIGMNHTNDLQLMFPTKGLNVNLQIEGGNTFNYILDKLFSYKPETPEYFKVQLTSSVYFPFFNLERSAFAFKVRSGIIHAYNGNKFKVPINQRFYSGGANSVRGWKARDLYSKSDRDITFEDIGDLSSQDFELIFNQKIVPGGFFMLEFSAEARIHLFGDFGSAFFVDAGNNWESPGEFTYRKIALSTGFGFRYYSPFAPIRVDFGIKLWDPQRNQNLSDWPHFYNDAVSIQIGIGEAF
ncbi:MAG: BamA/TamA family outer membrane protein, partial [Rhodothermaceae bacterium]